MTPEELVVLQAVVDRVGAYQETAEDRVIVDELREGVVEAGIDVPDERLHLLAEAIEREGGPVRVDAQVP
ncbi:hypothetical protein EKO23_22180 [Nocardioides guangzhouensis]|uniref:Uncharacterized protein n=1 Tax=Nocardioides guangzhouensis TaxID=2497878 RepID=A0A4Q4Z5F7_9ACTN|nr:hypothetical protein [Nocardioides guangzhouensis]RYP82271.1 hypothetical protein EKO23_22180 [Nocardioides guangzhouensis]